MQNKFSIYLTGFRKNHGTRHALLKTIETWSIIYMDSSKAFDSLYYELLITELKCYGLDHTVELFRSYLKILYECCKISNTVRYWRKVITGLPQGSTLGALLFNIFLNDTFFFLKHTSLGNSADSTLYVYSKNSETVISDLRQNFSILSNWFHDNFMVLNPRKCHFLTSKRINNWLDLQ